MSAPMRWGDDDSSSEDDDDDNDVHAAAVAPSQPQPETLSREDHRAPSSQQGAHAPTRASWNHVPMNHDPHPAPSRQQHQQRPSRGGNANASLDPYHHQQQQQPRQQQQQQQRSDWKQMAKSSSRFGPGQHQQGTFSLDVICREVCSHGTWFNSFNWLDLVL